MQIVPGGLVLHLPVLVDEAAELVLDARSFALRLVLGQPQCVRLLLQLHDGINLQLLLLGGDIRQLLARRVAVALLRVQVARARARGRRGLGAGRGHAHLGRGVAVGGAGGRAIAGDVSEVVGRGAGLSGCGGGEVLLERVLHHRAAGAGVCCKNIGAIEIIQWLKWMVKGG